MALDGALPAALVIMRFMIRWLRLSALVLGITVTVIGCQTGYATVVENRSSSAFIIHAMEETGPAASRYYALAPGASVLIDTVGHVNPAVASVTLMTPECQIIEVVAGNYSEGATVTIDEDESVQFERERTSSSDLPNLRGPDEAAHSHGTCQDAASSL